MPLKLTNAISRKYFGSHSHARDPECGVPFEKRTYDLFTTERVFSAESEGVLVIGL